MKYKKLLIVISASILLLLLFHCSSHFFLLFHFSEAATKRCSLKINVPKFQQIKE